MSIDLTFGGDTTAAGPLSKDVVKQYFDVAKNLVAVAKLGASMTPTPVDDKVIAEAEKVLAFVEPYLDQDWPYELVNAAVAVVTTLAKGGSPMAALTALVAAIQTMPAVK